MSKQKKSNVAEIKANYGNVKFSMGFDPEFFLATPDNKIVNAIHVLKKDKHNPIDLGNGVKAYYDSALLETSFPPVSSRDELLERIKTVYTKIQGFLGKNYRIVSKAAHNFDKAQLDCKEAWEIGCTPSLNVWTRSLDKPEEFPDTNRTSAGHIHIGHEKLTDFETRETAIKLLDTIVGCSLVVINKDETAAIRRKIYGGSGQFRICDYGLEWRVPDSFYLRSPETTVLVYDLVSYTLDIVINGDGQKILNKINTKNVIKAINTCDKALAKSILNVIGLPDDLMGRIYKDYNPNLYQDWNIAV